MKCPKDGTVLQPVEIHGVQLDKCHTCNGIWCDKGEIGRLKALHEEGLEAGVEERYGNPAVTTEKVTAYMLCPRCGKRLHRYHYTYARPVRVDRCENSDCYGIWLDQGELDAIIEELTALEQVESPAALGGFFSRFVAALRGD